VAAPASTPDAENAEASKPARKRIIAAEWTMGTPVGEIYAMVRAVPGQTLALDDAIQACSATRLTDR
jgi:hypothetical protein